MKMCFVKACYAAVFFCSIAIPGHAGQAEAQAAYEAGNYALAQREWQTLAEQGDAQAQVELGWLYGWGRGVAKDEVQAMGWYRKAAEQGNADGQSSLGIVLLDGSAALRDEAQALTWIRKAADQGNKTAQYNLAYMYANGRGVPKDEKQAVVWYRKAAEQGDRQVAPDLP